MNDNGKSKDIGRLLLTVGLAVAGSALTFAAQFGAMEERMDVLSRHAISSAHPPPDYRELVEGRLDRIGARQDRHETKDKH